MATEKRMIYLEDALKAISSEYLEGTLPEHDLALLLTSRRKLKNLKTVDAVEVVHGEWEIIEDAYFDLVELKCSVCGESWGFEDYEDCIPQNYHYCPNCGAKMDGERRT